jgi:hypothetical protein
MIKKIALATLGALLLQGSAMAADYKAAFARGKQVRVLTTAGKTITVRERYPVRDARVAPNGMAAAWLLVDETLEEPEGETGTATLVVYSKGKRRAVPCQQLIREYWFHAQGQQIAYDCGGRHFAGNEVLFDTTTLKEIARFNQGDVPYDKRPTWSSSSANPESEK